jgi:hypothetical protein
VNYPPKLRLIRSEAKSPDPAHAVELTLYEMFCVGSAVEEIIDQAVRREIKVTEMQAEALATALSKMRDVCTEIIAGRTVR